MKKMLMVLAGVILLFGSAMNAAAENDGGTFTCPGGNTHHARQGCTNSESCPVHSSTVRDETRASDTYVCPVGNEDCAGNCEHMKRGCGTGHRGGGRGHHRGNRSNV